TATRPRSPATADLGAASTISRSRPVNGSHGSTTNGSTVSSTTAPRQRSKPPTTVTNLSPARHEKPNRTSLRQTQAESVPTARGRAGIEGVAQDAGRETPRRG